MAIELTKKHIAVDLTLNGEGATFNNGSSTKNLNGLACDVNIEKAGLPVKNAARVDIANVTQDVVQKITTLSTTREQVNIKKNSIVVRAWEDGGSPSVVYKGTIFVAYGTYDSPDLGVHIEANTGIDAQTTPEDPFTRGGEVSAISIIQDCAERIGYTFKNNGVPDFKIRDPIYSGSAIHKIETIATDLDFQAIIDDEKVLIQPWGIADGALVDVNKTTGMIGYPFPDSTGIRFNHVYNPRFRQGGQVNMTSIVPRATGKWKIIKLRHRLQTEGFGRSWQSYVECTAVTGEG